MIRINLLRAAPAPERARLSPASSLVPLACAAVLLLSAAGIGWWYWTLSREQTQMAADLSTARQEADRLKTVIAEVGRFEARQQQLRERVGLIEQLRSNQTVPVRLVDAVSRSLPDLLWLTHIKQTGADLVIEGRSSTLLALSDLVANLATSGVFDRQVELVDSQAEPSSGSASGATAAEVIRFTVKARIAGLAEPLQPSAPTTGKSGGAR